jgi:mono/diheme cytochrome c family protein
MTAELFRRLALLLTAGLWLTAGPPESRAADPGIAARVKEIFRARCLECHGGTQTQAGVDVLDRESLLQKEKLVPGKPDESLIYQRISEEDELLVMPPEGQPRLSAEETALVRRWIAEGAAAFPDDVEQPDGPEQDPALGAVRGVNYVLDQILQHIRTFDDDDRRHIRYFSINHLLTSGATREELRLQQESLAKAINHLSREPQIISLEVVDPPAATVFAVDLRRLGWHREVMQAVGNDGTGRETLNLFDLVLLEYPYGILYEASGTFDRLAREYLIPAGMVRPVPYLRADWFVSVATQPPLYEDLLQLPLQLSELEADLGVNSEANIRDGIAQRAGMTVSGVSRNNRVVERHPFRGGGYWKSFDFASSQGRQNMFLDPIHLNEDGGEMIFNLPNGLQAYYVCDATGRRVAEAPTSIVTDRFADDRTVRNGLACMRCHDQGMKTFADNVRPAVAALPGSPGFSKRDVLRLYPEQEELDRLLETDRQRFLRAMEQVLGHPQETEPLIPVTRRFLEAPLQLTTASAELGLGDADSLKYVFRTPQFASAGLIALGSGGVVRRDMWEDYFDEVVRHLGLGIPVIPVDGLTRPDFQPASDPVQVDLSTGRKGNVFAPGDELVLTVTNRSSKDAFVELIGVSTDGRRVMLIEGPRRLKAGESVKFPETGGLKIQPTVGKEQITLYAAPAEFPPARLFRGKNIADRVVHAFYQPESSSAAVVFTEDPLELTRSTITIETR